MIGNRRMVRLAAPAVALAAIVYAVATGHVLAVEKEAPVLKDLADLDELKTLFNADEGSPRLLVLLSPT